MIGVPAECLCKQVSVLASLLKEYISLIFLCNTNIQNKNEDNIGLTEVIKPYEIFAD